MIVASTSMEKNSFGNSENWEYSSVPNGGCFEATVRWADQLTAKDFTSFFYIRFTAIK